MGWILDGREGKKSEPKDSTCTNRLQYRIERAPTNSLYDWGSRVLICDRSPWWSPRCRSGCESAAIAKTLGTTQRRIRGWKVGNESHLHYPLQDLIISMLITYNMLWKSRGSVQPQPAPRSELRQRRQRQQPRAEVFREASGRQHHVQAPLGSDLLDVAWHYKVIGRAILRANHPHTFCLFIIC